MRWTHTAFRKRLPEFIPGLATSRVTARKGPVVTVAQTGVSRVTEFTIRNTSARGRSFAPMAVVPGEHGFPAMLTG